MPTQCKVILLFRILLIRSLFGICCGHQRNAHLCWPDSVGSWWARYAVGRYDWSTSYGLSVDGWRCISDLLFFKSLGTFLESQWYWDGLGEQLSIRGGIKDNCFFSSEKLRKGERVSPNPKFPYEKKLSFFWIFFSQNTPDFQTWSWIFFR